MRAGLMVAVVVLVAGVACHKSPEAASGGGGATKPRHPGCLERCSLDTDDGVNAALVKSGRKPMEGKGGCIERVLDDRVVKLGDFADDRGCMWREAFVGCCLDPLDNDALLLADLGWAGMAPEARATLAVDYLWALWGVRGMSEAAPEFGRDGHPPFEAPATVSLPDGGVRHTAWIEGGDGGGMTKQTIRTFTRTEFTFSAAGAIERKDLTSFSVPVR